MARISLSDGIGCQIFVLCRHFAHNGIGANDVLTAGRRGRGSGRGCRSVATFLSRPLFMSLPPTEVHLQGFALELRYNFGKKYCYSISTSLYHFGVVPLVKTRAKKLNRVKLRDQMARNATVARSRFSLRVHLS